MLYPKYFCKVNNRGVKSKLVFDLAFASYKNEEKIQFTSIKQEVVDCSSGSSDSNSSSDNSVVIEQQQQQQQQQQQEIATVIRDKQQQQRKKKVKKCGR